MEQIAMDEQYISIVIVTADSGPSTRECVNRALASDVAVEVIVVDNGSEDGEPEAIARAHSDLGNLHILYNRSNLGFGAAANIGATQARGDHVVFLNPDCMLQPGTMRRMREALASRRNGGLVGVVIQSPDGAIDPSSRRRDPLLQRVRNTLRGKTDSVGLDGVHVPGPLPQGVSVEEAVSGALMMLPMRVFERCRGFDEDFFLHFEDLDLCRRVRDAGYEVLLAGDVCVEHAGGGSSHHRPVFVSRHKHTGMWRWLRNHDPVLRKPWIAAVVWLGIWSHFLITLPGTRAGKRKRPVSDD
jgi:N-acetylglucosaminyl-diphospho-decaprenol L-rhamnosyltransferase